LIDSPYGFGQVLQMTGKTLGPLIGAIRKDRRWTLKEMSERIGIPLSTLAKIEADQLSLAFEKLVEVTARLGLSVAEFMAYESSPNEGGPAPSATTARRSISDESTTLRVRHGQSDYDFLCADLKNKYMTPCLITVHGDTLQDHVPMTSGSGDEFIYVVEGKVEVHTEFYNAIPLGAGDSIYLDGSMKHAYIARDCDQAILLGISSEQPKFEGLDG
jgi:transcriptional regulator with XRE-family HTH domain